MGEATVGTVTVLFTDLVDSTRLLQLGAEAADEVRRAHFDDVGRCVDAHRGVVVKNTGDGIMATFASANDAVTAAEVIQQTVDHRRRTDPRTCAVRVGVASGEASHEGDDWFGAPVILAARLCAAAESGGILVTALTRLLMDGRGEHRFVDQGGVLLKGFDEPVEVAGLLWDRWEPPGLPAPALAARSSDRTPFVGRSREMDHLLDTWKDAEAGTRQVAFVGGEPGMGKTRLLGELAAQVHESGGRVLWGRCDDDAVVPFQPWVEILRQALEVDGSGALFLQHPMLDVLLPELGDGGDGRRPRGGGRGSRPTPIPGSDPETERMRLFDAVSDAIAELADEGPLLVVIDDLHWAARPSLLLFRHLVRRRADLGILLVASYRDNEVDHRHPLADLLADMGRDEHLDRYAIRGLAEHEVLELVRSSLEDRNEGPDESDESDESAGALAVAVHRETNGNPFFVGQVLSHLAELDGLAPSTGRRDLPADLAELGVPDGVREVIGRRLGRLSDAANRALTVAAIVGAEFDLDGLEGVPDASDGGSDLLDALDESLRARLIEEVEGRPGRYVFVHALVRQTLLGDLSAARRARLHRHVAETIASRPNPDPAVLAGHFCAGATIGDVDDALFWSAVAADAAITGLAAEDGLALLERAFVVAELEPDPDHRVLSRMWLLVAAGHQWIGETEPAKRASDRAAQEARAGADPELLALAASHRAGWAVAGSFDQVAGDMVMEALDRLGSSRPDLRSRLLVTLALHRAVTETQGLEAEPLSDEALALAREVGDPELISMVLSSTVLMHTAGPDLDVQERMVAELEDLIPQLTSVYEVSSNRVTVQRVRVVTDMQRGETARARHWEVAATGIYPAMEAMWRGMHHHFAGRFAEAEAANEALVPFIDLDLNFGNSWAAQLFRIRRDQGRVADLVPSIAGFVTQTPGLIGLQTVHALALVDIDELEPARQILHRLAPDGFAGVPSDSVLSSCLSDLAEVVARVGDPEMAAALHERLSPFAGQLLVVSWGVACLGAADRYLAMLEWVLGRHEEAEAHLAAALALEEQAGGRPAAARTRLWWGDLLLQRRRGDDVTRAQELLAASMREADELGLLGIRARAEELLGR